MGLLSSTSSPVSLRCATCKALTTCIITLRRSLADLGGGFDVPKPKCPPDRGSSDRVTGSPASIFSDSYPSLSKSPTLEQFSKSPPGSHSPYSSNPVPIPRNPSRTDSGLSTPPLTPDDDSESDSEQALCTKPTRDALNFLLNIFPHQGLTALPHARSVSISAPNMGVAFDGVVLALPNHPKTLYVDGKSAESVSLRESIVALLDLADEQLECSALVIVLERASANLGELLHSLMYVGGTVVTKPPFQADSAFVLVGLEI